MWELPEPVSSKMFIGIPFIVVFTNGQTTSSTTVLGERLVALRVKAALIVSNSMAFSDFDRLEFWVGGIELG